MAIIGAIVIGFIVGLLARFIMPGQDPGGIIVTVLIGIAGSFAGTFLGQAVGLYGPGETAGFIGSVVGAICILALWRAVMRGRVG